MALVLVAGSNPRCCWPNSSAPSPNQGGSSRRGDAMSEAGKRLLDLPNCRPETHARHGGDHSMLCFIGAVPGLITMKEWERLDREREIAGAVAAERARIAVGVAAEPSERIEDNGNIGRRAYGSLGIEPDGSGYIEVVGRTAVLRIIEGGYDSEVP